MHMSGQHLLEGIVCLQNTTFPQLLQQLLREAGFSKSDLYNYLYTHQYTLEKTSMYRYFNSSTNVARIPDETFLAHFADFIGLDDTNRRALFYARQMKLHDRRHWRGNGSQFTETL